MSYFTLVFLKFSKLPLCTLQYKPQDEIDLTMMSKSPWSPINLCLYRIQLYIYIPKLRVISNFTNETISYHSFILKFSVLVLGVCFDLIVYFVI